MKDKVVVQIADMQIAENDDILITYALGSCVGISIYDPILKIGALIHIMLPERKDIFKYDKTYKFADVAIRETLLKLRERGCVISRVECKIAGGANMFKSTNQSAINSIGQSNIASVRKNLNKYEIKILKEDVGEDYARTMSLDLINGEVTIKSSAHGILKM